MSTSQVVRFQSLRDSLAGALLAAGALVIISAADRTPANSAAPLVTTSLATPSAAHPSEITIVTFNIHSGKGHTGQLDLAHTAKVIGPAEVVALNEVRAPWSGPNQAAQLGQLRQQSSIFAATERQWGHDHFGNGLLTSLPCASATRIPLPGTRGKAFRNLLLAEVGTAESAIRVLVVHADRAQDRATHVKAAFDVFRNLQSPAVMLGDFNSDSRDDVLQQCLIMARADGVIDPFEECQVDRPIDTIDWVFIKGLQPLSAAIVPNTASDHPAIRVTLRRPPSANSSGPKEIGPQSIKEVP